MYHAYEQSGLYWWCEKNVTCSFRKMTSLKEIILATCPHWQRKHYLVLVTQSKRSYGMGLEGHCKAFCAWKQHS